VGIIVNDDFVRKLLERSGIDARPATQFTSDTDLVIPIGARNDTLAAIYGTLLKMRVAPNLARGMVRGIGADADAVEETLSPDEVDAIIDHLEGRDSQPFDTDWYTLTRITNETAVPPLKWLIPGIAPAEGITLIHGLPAQGKSYTAQDIMFCASLGVPALGLSYPTDRPRKGAYFDWERRGSMYTRRMQQLARGHNLPVFATDYYEVRKPLGQVIQGIRELTLVHGYEFAIFDSLSIAIMTADLMAAHEVIPQMFAMHDRASRRLKSMTNVAHERRPVSNTFWTDAEGNPTGGITTGQGFTIAWQNGVQERNGAFLEEVLGACKARFDFFQASKFACSENADAIAGIEAALEAMGRRFAARAGRGVEGSYKV
jgi:hypothetical protein